MGKSSTSYTEKNETSFKAGNQMWKLRTRHGKPEYWTTEKIEEIIDALAIWMEKEDSIVMSGYRSEIGITYQTMVMLKEKSPDFKYIYELACEKVATRLAQKVGKKVHHVHYTRYIGIYDRELREAEKQMSQDLQDIEALAKAKSSYKAVYDQLNNPPLNSISSS